MNLLPLLSGILLCVLLRVNAHSFLTSPHPISNLDGCRIGGTGGFNGNCPGPCPNYRIAADAEPSNPTAVFQRGHYHRVVWTRNNHEGGFVRWSMVPLNKMKSKHWHAKMAFHYHCWNVGRFNCNAFDFHRDCNYDRKNEAYSKMLYIPPIYPDGDYVLGWTWYGGGLGSGHFGDYYDCAYVRVKGGDPIQPSYTPEFHVGGDTLHADGCEATVNDLGICWKEPCLPLRKTSKKIPKQFENGPPDPVLSEWYGDANEREFATVKLESLHLVDAKRNVVLDIDLAEIIGLNRRDEISLLAETRGDVDYVEWYTNGKASGRDYGLPYTIAGDFRGDFYPWMYPIFNRRMRLAVKVVGKDGTFAWGNVELRFQEAKGPGAARFPGRSWDEFLELLGDHTEDVTHDHDIGEPSENIGEPMEAEGEEQEEQDTEASVTIDDNSIGPQPVADDSAVEGDGPAVEQEPAEELMNSDPVTISEVGLGAEESAGSGTATPAGSGTSASTGSGASASTGSGSPVSASSGSAAPAGSGSATSTSSGSAVSGGSSSVSLGTSSTASAPSAGTAAEPVAVAEPITVPSSFQSSSSGSSVSLGKASLAGAKRGKAFADRRVDQISEDDELNLAMAAFA